MSIGEDTKTGVEVGIIEACEVPDALAGLADIRDGGVASLPPFVEELGVCGLCGRVVHEVSEAFSGIISVLVEAVPLLESVARVVISRVVHVED